MEHPSSLDTAPLLTKARVLVVEDDFLILMELEAVLRDAGADIAGLCRNVREALAAADGGGDVGVALLDVRLGNDTVAPVARALTEHGTPFVFYTGQVDTDPILAEWPDCRVVSKPAAPHTIVTALLDAMRMGACPGCGAA
ncbi:MAG TPA: response regulator [Gammaproteobacteria bacterium]|jgi:DNA-binding NtrC family response regulator|nr:response regulator [Gammaproteobacteria bacterium]